MRSFSYERADSIEAALSAAGTADAKYLAGGTELVNWLKLGLAAPARIIDITGLPMRGIEATPQRLRIGALTTLSEIGEHPDIMRDYPVLSQAALKAASAQIRNMATLGGNVLQRTRCPYFRAERPLPCNRREPGTGCSARHGENRQHAIFGWSDACVATQPSDPAVALAVLDATADIVGPKGRRQIPMIEFHRLPGDMPVSETLLTDGELITAFEVPAAPSARSSHYLKVRERESYEYAMVSAAVTLELDGGGIRTARVALGSVAARPWRLSAAETSLRGVAFERSAMMQAVDGAFGEVRPLAHNGHKVQLAKNAVVRALEHAGGLA